MTGIIIHVDDIVCLEGISERQAQRIYRLLKDIYKTEKVTLKHLSDYYCVDEQWLLKQLS